MVDPGRVATRRSWPSGAIGMVVLVVLVEGALAGRGRDLSMIFAESWARSGRAAGREATRAEVLGLGDSLVMHGFAPRVFEARGGRTAFNLAMPRGAIPAADFLLRRVLHAGGHPAALLIDGELLEDDPRELTRLWPEMSTWPELAELAWKARDASFFGRIALSRLLTSVRCRFEIRDLIIWDLSHEAPAPRSPWLPQWRNWRQNQGAQLLAVKPIPAGGDPRPAVLEATAYRPASWVCDPINALYLDQLLARAGSRDIPVFWLLPPVHPEVQTRRDRGGREARYVRFLHDLQARFPGLTVMDGRYSGYEAEVLDDMTHLNVRGASAFSAALGGLVAERLELDGSAGPRWVSLPAYRDPAAEGLVEDMDQTLTAIRTRVGTTRLR